MATQLLCPHCGGTLALPAAAGAGAMVRCPMCHQTFTVQSAAAVAPSPAAPAPAPAPKPVSHAAPAQPTPPPARAVAAKAAAPPRTPPPRTPPRASAPRASVPRASSGRNGQQRSTASGRGLLLLGGVAATVVALLMLGGAALLVRHILMPDRPADKVAGPPVAAAPGPIPEPIADNTVPPHTNSKDPLDPTPPVQEKPWKKQKPTENGSGLDIADLKKPDPTPPVPPLPKDKEPVKGPPSVTTPPDNPKSPPDNPKSPDNPKPPPEVAITIPGTPAVPGVTAARIKDAIAKGVQFLKKRQAGDGGYEPPNSLSHRTGYSALAALALLECEVPATDPSVANVMRFIRADAEQINDVYSLSAAILALDRLGDKRDRPLIQHLAARLVAAQGFDAAWTYDAQIVDPQTEQLVVGFLRTHWPWSAAQPRPDGPLKAGKGKQLKLPRVDPAKLPAAELTWNRWSRAASNGDHSNTQFALLALWAARRHGVPVECPILASYQHFVNAQQADGGWPYTVGNSTDTMTCAGLLGLAMGHGALPPAAGAADKQDLLKNPAIDKGLTYVGRSIGKPATDAAAQPGLPNLYLLWSIERVAMLYDLKTIDGKDWYGWGAQALLANQSADGSWGGGGYQGANALANTCFALLFLKRCNLVPDLTENLRLQMVIRDPGAR